MCTRPFRPSGPRLETESVSGKRIIHSYGHGGSGWSLAWGAAEDVAALVLAEPTDSAAVIGAGAIGLSTALRLQQAGIATTIHAREFPAESRSARAAGVWSPDSRIALADAVSPDFPATWERQARQAYAANLRYVGRAGHPIEFIQHYFIPRAADTPLPAPYPVGGRPYRRGEASFLHLNHQIRDVAPAWGPVTAIPFDAKVEVRGGLVMTFNVAEYSRQLMTDFLTMGGRLLRASFDKPAEIAALPSRVIINCTGYGARALFGDESLVPIRGQIGWLAPQTDRLYGVYHNEVTVISRRDGVVVQYVGPDDYTGYGIESEVPDRNETIAALARVAPLMEWS